jgi:hypothetical protein
VSWKPCNNCPYRKDAPTEFWHREEFENLLESDADPLNGGIFACHKGKDRPPEERTVCIGWLLDQKNRNIPSIQLRLKLLRDSELVEITEQATGEGLELYDSIEEMCKANGIR